MDRKASLKLDLSNGETEVGEDRKSYKKNLKLKSRNRKINIRSLASGWKFKMEN